VHNGLIRVTAWLITMLLVVALAGVIGWTLRSQPTMLALPTPHLAVAAAATEIPSLTPTMVPIPTVAATAAVTSTVPAEEATTIAPTSTAASTVTSTAASAATSTPTSTATTAPTRTETSTVTSMGTVIVTVAATAGPHATPTTTPVATSAAAGTEPVSPLAAPTAAHNVTGTIGGPSAPSVTIPITLPEQAAASPSITTVEIVGLPAPTATPAPPPFGNGSWAALTDPNDMNELVVISNTLWIAGNGGGLAWSKGSTTPVVYTAADGLYGNQLTAVADCALPGFGVVYGSPAGLQVVDAHTGRWRQISITDGQNEGMHYNDVTALYCDVENGFLIVGYGEHGIDIYDAKREEWRHLDRNSGLAANDVNALAVVGDRDEVWVASDEGVTVSAGSDSAFYDAANSDLAADRVGALAAAPDGSVWLGGEGAVYRVDGDNWTVYAAGSVAGDFPTAPIEGMAFGPDGSLWLGSADATVCRFDVARGRCADFYRPEANTGAGMAAGPLTSLAVDTGGDVYYTTAGNGYAVFDSDKWRTFAVRRPPLTGDRVKALATDAGGSLWVATEAGVQRLEDNDASNTSPKLFTAEDVGIAAADVRVLHPGRDKGMWVGGAGGASFFDGSGWQTLTAREGLVGNVVQAVTVDGEGRTWFGTDRGISIWNGSSIFTIDKARGLPSDDIRALASDSSGVWIGTAGGGLYRFSGSQLQLLNRQNVGLPSDNITQLAVGPDGALWIGSDLGLARLADGSLTAVKELAERAVTSLAVTGSGEVWAGTGSDSSSAGLFYGDGSRWTQLTLADRLPSPRITALLAEERVKGESASGSTVWIGGEDGGVMRFQRQEE
jgi:ligand-binding sensor domain-containing protein